MRTFRSGNFFGRGLAASYAAGRAHIRKLNAERRAGAMESRPTSKPFSQTTTQAASTAVNQPARETKVAPVVAANPLSSVTLHPKKS